MKPQHCLVSNSLVYHLMVLNAIHCFRKSRSLTDVNSVSLAMKVRLNGVSADVKAVRSGRF